jgi:hypothetical protein
MVDANELDLDDSLRDVGTITYIYRKVKVTSAGLDLSTQGDGAARTINVKIPIDRRTT